jgi:protein gp37
MGDKTKIEWTDATWNPIRGCSVVSEGCRNCYAMQVAARFSQRYWEVWQGSTLICSAKQKLTEAEARNKVANEARNGVVMEVRESSEGQAYAGLAYRNSSGAHWTGKVRLIEEHLEDPLRWKRPRRIFVNSMSDLFHESVPDSDIEAIFGVMATAGHHTFQILTKRPERMLDFVSKVKHSTCVAAMIVKGSNTHSEGGRRSRIKTMPRGWPWPLRNVWLGVSVEDQKTADERIPLLLQTPAAVRWISAEPLLGAIDLTRLKPPSVTWMDCLEGREHFGPGVASGGPHLDWVVVGGESGSGARPMHPEWVRSIRDQCARAGVPFFFKQWGAWGPVTHYSMRGVDHPSLPTYQSQQFEVFALGGDRLSGAAGSLVGRLGKKAAGNTLDGHQHLEYPA